MSKINDRVDSSVLWKIKERAMQDVCWNLDAFESQAEKAGMAIGDTPIKRALLIAFWSMVQHGGYSFYKFVPVYTGGPQPNEKAKTDRELVIAWLQKTVLDWPVDFVFGFAGATEASDLLVVECDGHEFHERTREQAARDRSRDRRLQQAGHTVFRYTGSEIWRDPCGCAEPIIRWLEGRQVARDVAQQKAVE